MITLAFHVSRTESFFKLSGKSVCFYQSLGKKDPAAFFVHDIDLALKSLGYSWSNIKAVCTTHGPGSFTSIRLGLSFVYGLALGQKNLEIYTNNTFEILKKGIDSSQNVMILVDNARGGFFSRIYQGNDFKEAIYTHSDILTYPDLEKFQIISDVSIPSLNHLFLTGEEFANALLTLLETSKAVSFHELKPFYGHTPHYQMAL